VIDGQKMFTTAANLADYVFLLVRTNPDVPKHAGLTLFLVPMDLPGIEVHPVYTLQDERTNITYLSEVVVPDRYRVGEIDGGTAVMAATLELEHGGDQYRISFHNMYKHALEWAQCTQRDGQPMLANADVRRRLARVAVHTTIARDLCYRTIWGVQEQAPNRAAFGPMSKLFSTEQYQRDALDLMDLCAPDSLLQSNAGLGHVELGYRQSIGMTIYGGTSEIHRSLIAEQALGMPRSRT
jgi:alkylation response protein AidB-like acyl-CoA dehydrogenase